MRACKQQFPSFLRMKSSISVTQLNALTYFLVCIRRSCHMNVGFHSLGATQEGTRSCRSIVFAICHSVFIELITVGVRKRRRRNAKRVYLVLAG